MPANVGDHITQLRESVQKASLPDDLRSRVLDRLGRIERIGETPAGFDELDRTIDYIDWLVNLPWNIRSEDVLDLTHTKQVLDKNHFGLEDIKNRILEYVSVIKLNKDKVPSHFAEASTDAKAMVDKSRDKLVSQAGEYRLRAPILCFVGLAGTGKTTVAYSIAEALGRSVQRIPLGGIGDALDLRGQSKLHAEAEPGLVIKAMRRANVKNPVILVDEIDRVEERGRAGVMGVLLELLDPEQNHSYTDHYIDWPFDLSEVLFVTTANNTTNISTAVLDRLEVIHMPSYSDEEKINIGKNYMLPQVIEQSGLPREVLQIQDEVWSSIVRPLGFDAGMRTLERSIQGIVRKIAKEYVEGKTTKVNLTSENIKQYLPTW